MPICRPKCDSPDDQFGSLNVKRCARCIAGTSCNCHLSCYTKESSTGAKGGDKQCSFIKGSGGKPAAAIWEPIGGETASNPAGVPQCLPPMKIQVQDARTQKPLRGVTIRVAVPYSGDSDRLRTILKLNTDDSRARDLSVEFSSEARDLYVTIEKEKYASITRKLDRGKNCKDAYDCIFRFSISAKLKGGELYPEGCFLIGNPKNINWEMRAVLEWDQTPNDLDIWTRYYEGYQDVELAYHCDGSKPHTLDPTDPYSFSRRRTVCKRTVFATNDNVRAQEWKASGLSICEEKPENKQTIFVQENGVRRPDCRYPAHNQFPKWVFWAVRKASFLNKRWIRKPVTNDYMTRMSWRTLTEKEWNEDHYMVLDIDQRNGFGPETVTFRNVPPGTYQVVVNQYSGSGKKLDDIKEGNPRVSLYVGSNSIPFECMIPPECLKKNRVWNVANIQVQDLGLLEGSTTGEHKFSIRIADEAQDMIPLKWVDLPTGGNEGSDEYGMKYYYPHKVTGVEYNDEQLSTVCYGECEPVDETFKDCKLTPPRQRRLREEDSWQNATVKW